MTVAELFVNIGVKGAGETAKSFSEVNKSLQGVKSDSIAAKAAVLGVVYALEQMVVGGGERGMDLQKLENYTGISNQTFQKMALYLQKGGVAAKDANGAIVTLQSSMEKLAEGKGPPGMLQTMANAVGGLDSKRFRDPLYMIGKLQQALKVLPVAMGNEMGLSMGISPDVIQALRTLTDMDLSKIHALYSDRAVHGLAAMNVQWERLGTQFNALKDSFALSFGPKVIAEMSMALRGVNAFSKDLTRLCEKEPAVKAFAVALGAIALLAVPFGALGVAITTIITGLAELEKHKNEKDGFWGLMNEKHLEQKIIPGISGVVMNFYGATVKEAAHLKDKMVQGLKDYAHQNPTGGPGGN